MRDLIGPPTRQDDFAEVLPREANAAESTIELCHGVLGGQILPSILDWLLKLLREVYRKSRVDQLYAPSTGNQRRKALARRLKAGS